MSALHKLHDRRRFAWQTYRITTFAYWLTANLLLLPVLFVSTEGWRWDVAIGLMVFIAVILLLCNLLTCIGHIRRINRFTEFEYQQYGEISDYKTGRDLWDAMVDYEKAELGKDYQY